MPTTQLKIVKFSRIEIPAKKEPERTIYAHTIPKHYATKVAFNTGKFKLSGRRRKELSTIIKDFIQRKPVPSPNIIPILRNPLIPSARVAQRHKAPSFNISREPVIIPVEIDNSPVIMPVNHNVSEPPHVHGNTKYLDNEKRLAVIRRQKREYAERNKAKYKAKRLAKKS